MKNKLDAMELDEIHDDGKILLQAAADSGWKIFNGKALAARITDQGKDDDGRGHVWLEAAVDGGKYWAIGGAWVLDEGDAEEANMLKGHFPGSVMADTVWAGDYDVWTYSEELEAMYWFDFAKDLGVSDRQDAFEIIKEMASAMCRKELGMAP